MMAVFAMLATLGGATSTPPHLDRLGQPCRAKNVLAGRVVVDRTDGREWLVLTNMNETSGAELMFIDFIRNTGRTFHAPAGAGSWALNEVPGDRLIVGTFYDGQFMVFDLKQMQFVKTVGFPGESYIWNLALGSDGRIYGGTYGGGKLGAFDLHTYTVEDCGAPAPPNLYLRNVSSTPDGRILCQFGMEKPATLLYDPATKTFGPVPAVLEGVSLGVSWNGYFLAGAQVLQGKALTPVSPPPFPIPPADKGGWAVDTYLTTEETLFLRQGNTVYRYRKGDSSLTLVADIDLRGGRILASDRNGDLLGVRGQDYFRLKPGDKSLTLRPIPVESGPRPTLFLKADDHGRLWGGPNFGLTLFHLDTRRKSFVNTGIVTEGGGEVYDVTFLHGKVYAASYAGGDITCYDPAQPWDEWHDRNPKRITHLAEKGYIRPTGGILVGPEGKLVSGWMAKYGTYGGAIALTDPTTGDTRLIENPLGAQAVTGLAVEGSLAYVGTALEANGLPEKKGETARFGMVDLTGGKAVWTQELTGAHRVGPLAYDRKTGRLALAVDGRLRLFDSHSRTFLPDIVGDTACVSSHALCAPGDGKVYYGNRNALAVVDLLTGQVERIVEAPATVDNVTVAPDGEIYLSCGADVFRLRR